MRKRTKARDIAIQILYELDIKKETAESLLEEYWQRPALEDLADKDIKSFTTALVEGTIKNKEEIDKIISSYAQNWELKRMAVIDRNILRMGTYELLFLEDIPPKVSINEAVELAKKYGDTDSSKFVNGVIDKIKKEKAPKK